MTPGRVLVGGVGYRWHGDGSFGLVVADRLAALDRPAHVEVADLGYGALWVVQDLAAADPPYARLILLGATVRGRAPGQLYRERWRPGGPDTDEIQARIREAGAGVLDVDHLLVIAQHFQALPADVLVLELEPLDLSGGAGLSAEAQARVPEAIDLVQRAVLPPAADVATAASGRIGP
jgi:hydrogenase maturation protease